MAELVAELIWVQNLMKELRFQLPRPPQMYCEIMIADLLTKALPCDSFLHFRQKMNVVSGLASDGCLVRSSDERIGENDEEVSKQGAYGVESMLAEVQTAQSGEHDGRIVTCSIVQRRVHDGVL
ncbi:hypothetical protein PIB30_074098 [Stylosanthes scabra]|uniref:Uncharacterized protein n=1 Tax=Stylosanthes scabra TaxID=79078 RepID=A0ABU6SRG1_9FABA|nr:hypothetical protein [Stylosanthes scabra]